MPEMRTTRVFILLWAIFIIYTPITMGVETVSFATIVPPAEKDIVKIAILGDRTGGNPEGLKFLQRAIYEINQLNPDFVIHIGDKVLGYTRDQDEWLRECKEFKSYMDKLDVPWYAVAGNHDVFTPIRDPSDRTYEELYKKYFSPLYYSFDYKNSHFVVMYTDEAMESRPVISDKQIEWLRADLENTHKTNIFIFMHKPAWTFENSNWEKVHQTLTKYPVKAVVAGHFHAYFKDANRDGIQYYAIGPTGAEAYTSGHELTGFFHQYIILSVEGDKFKTAVVKLGNVESDEFVLSKDYTKIWDITAISQEKTGMRGWLWQPASTPISGEIEVYAYNPLDVNIPVEVRLDANMKLWSMKPAVIKLNLLSKSSGTAKAVLSSPKADHKDIIPPQLEFEYEYTNSRGEKVPVIVKCRVFLRDTYNIHKINETVQIDGVKSEPFWQKVSPLYNYTWIYSVYERSDAPPKIYLASDNTDLYFFAEVMDDKYSYLKESKKGILSDAIVFSTQPDSTRKDIVIYPFNEENKSFLAKDSRLIPSEMSIIPGVAYSSKKDAKAGYYYCEGKIPLSSLFKPVDMKEAPFNVGVIDNDLEAFIYLRSWAFDREPQYWGVLKFTAK